MEINCKDTEVGFMRVASFSKANNDFGGFKVFPSFLLMQQ